MPSDEIAAATIAAGASRARVVAVASGKGGVGKTNVSVNLAAAQAMAGKRVWLLDADLGLANVDVLLGLQVGRNLSHVLGGECELADILIDGPSGMKIIPASSGVQQMASLSALDSANLVHAFSELADELDLLVVDSSAGISHSVTMFASAADDVLVVVCDEPASITDAYALIKVLSRDHGVRRVRVLANMVRSAKQGQILYRKLARVTDRYLDVVARYAGYVPHDDLLQRALRKRKPVVTAFPETRATQAFKKLAESVDTWDRPDGASGGIQFFLESAVGPVGSGRAEA